MSGISRSFHRQTLMDSKLPLIVASVRPTCDCWYICSMIRSDYPFILERQVAA